MATKYIFFTGGVVSSVGKGVTAAALGRLLKERGFAVAVQKLDGQLVPGDEEVVGKPTGIYRVVQLEQGGAVRDVMKRSIGKATWPGRKQVWRVVESGEARYDVVALEHEPPVANAVPLLVQIMRDGRRLGPQPTLADMRMRCREQISMIPQALRTPESTPGYHVERSKELERMIDGRE